MFRSSQGGSFMDSARLRDDGARSCLFTGDNVQYPQLFQTDKSDALPKLSHSLNTGSDDPEALPTSSQKGKLLPTERILSEKQDQKGDIINKRCSDDSMDKKLLICPFYVLDDVRYIKCRPLTLTDISALKQHMKRCHVSKGNSSQDDDLSQEELAKLKNCMPRGADIDRWYWIWDQFFKKHPRPKSPYLPPDYYANERLLPYYETRLREEGVPEKYIATMSRVIRETSSKRPPIPPRFRQSDYPAPSQPYNKEEALSWESIENTYITRNWPQQGVEPHGSVESALSLVWTEGPSSSSNQAHLDLTDPQFDFNNTTPELEQVSPVDNEMLGHLSLPTLSWENMNYWAE
ncbi:hypothetical protein BGZ63DRAFT_455219 [Mariannaea sp. PMI_226]|nr:hypothetical protein BGZ63DRAFT_455219 [Mariannaea sp. PMI_226]